MAQDHFIAGADRFPVTRWSVIEGARSPDGETRKRALNTLCEAYWRPVYKYVRLRWNRDGPRRPGLTQGFFAEMLGARSARSFRFPQEPLAHLFTPLRG